MTAKHTPEDWAAFNEAERLERVRDAAPEMLEALRWFLDEARTNGGPMKNWMGTHLARAAVLKATGEHR